MTTTKQGVGVRHQSLQYFVASAVILVFLGIAIFTWYGANSTEVTREILPDMLARQETDIGKFKELCEQRSGTASFHMNGPDLIGQCYATGDESL